MVKTIDYYKVCLMVSFSTACGINGTFIYNLCIITKEHLLAKKSTDGCCKNERIFECYNNCLHPNIEPVELV